MKKQLNITFLFLVLSFSTNAQVNLQLGNLDAIMLQQGAGKIFRNSKIKDSKIQGSPYLQKMFAAAKVENVTQKYFMRYNVFEDEFEFITPKNDTLILDKIKDFNKITFSGTNKKYVLVEYTNSGGKLTKGYLIELYLKGKSGLYEKENISFYPGKIAKTSLEKDMPARYAKADPRYYFNSSETNIIEFPENKKQLFKLFPEKKSVIEAFLKENKIDFDLETDKIRIIDFLATI